MMIDDIPSKLLPHAERCLYYNYHNHFERIKTCLDMIYHEAMDQAGETWGRISALAYLSGHIDRNLLFKSLEQSNENDAWKGAGE